MKNINLNRKNLTNSNKALSSEIKSLSNENTRLKKLLEENGINEFFAKFDAEEKDVVANK